MSKPEMSRRYTTAFSYLVLGATAIHCWKRYYTGEWRFAYGTFGVVTANAVMGLYKNGLEIEQREDVEETYEFTQLCHRLFTLSCMVTETWLWAGLRWEFAVAHCAVSIIPLVTWLSRNDKRDDLIHLFTGFNIISLAAVSFMKVNYYGIAAAIVYFANDYFILNLEEGYLMDAPSQDWYNYGVAIFLILSTNLLFTPTCYRV